MILTVWDCIVGFGCLTLVPCDVVPPKISGHPQLRRRAAENSGAPTIATSCRRKSRGTHNCDIVPPTFAGQPQLRQRAAENRGAPTSDPRGYPKSQGTDKLGRWIWWLGEGFFFAEFRLSIALRPITLRSLALGRRVHARFRTNKKFFVAQDISAPGACGKLRDG